MANENQITFFACGNGDASLIEADDYTIMTDINYRTSGANDDDNKDVPDFSPKIRSACNDDFLNIFVLTHPDEDHLRGFCEIFHTGKPEERDADPDEGNVKIIINEIWCSEYAANPNYTTDASEPVIDEIKRRKKILDTVEGKKDGNRLKILTADEALVQNLTDGISWCLLAPNDNESTVEKTSKDEANKSSNPTSIVIQWSITVGEKTSKIILGGDSTVEVWERFYEDYSDEFLEWHILLAPHHCSRHSMGRKENVGTESEKFIFSSSALSALNHPIGTKPHVVASCRKFGTDTPPHKDAREKYYKIISTGDTVTDNDRSRFKCTSGKRGKDKMEDIIFTFTSKGAALKTLASPAIIVKPAASGGGGYGQN